MSPSTILIIDRDEEANRGYSRLLEDEGWTVLFASNETEALSRIHGACPEAIVIDADTVSPPLPFVESLRRENFALSVVVTSASPSIERATRLIRAGAHEYVGKPFPLIRLTDAIEEASRCRRAPTREGNETKELAETKHELDELRRKHEQLHEELKMLIAESKDLSDDRSASRAEAEEAKTLAATLRDELETIRNETDALRAELDEARRGAEEARADAGDRDGLRAELDAARKETSDLRAELDEARREADEARADAGDRDGLRAELDAARKETDALRAELDETRREAEEARADAGDRDGLRAELDAARKETDALRAELDEARRRAEEADAATAESGAEDEEKAELLEAARIKIEGLLAEVQEERDRTRDLENQMLELGESLTELQGDQLQALKDHEDLQLKLTEAERLLREEKTRRIEAEDALEDARRAKPDGDTAGDDARSAELEKRCDGLREELASGRTREEKLQEEIDSLRGRCAELESEKQAAEAMTSALESQALRLREELERTETDVSHRIEDSLSKERQQVEAEASQLLQYLKFVLDEMFCGYLIIDENERIVTLNPQVGSLFGLAPEEMSERTLDELPALSHLKGLFREFRASGETIDEREVALELGANETIPVLLKFLEANMADRHSHLVVIQDISAIAEFKQKTEYLSGLEDFGTLAVTHMEQIKETLFAIRMSVENLKLLLHKQSEPLSLAQETLRSIDEVVPLLQMIYDSYYAAEESLEMN